MTGTTINSGSGLLVPMHLDALVINKKITDRGIYNRWRMNYSQMNKLENPMLPPFDDQKTTPPPVGVHLHWALPAGLTHGVETQNGGFEFPYVPNRWLVVRIQPGSDSNSSIAAWVVLSDKLSEESADFSFRDPLLSSSFLDPLKSKPGQIVPTRLGASMKLQEWDKLMGEKGITPMKPFLKAIAPGNVTFAAFAPGVQNVFAFHDDLGDLEATHLTYLVLGWYSKPDIMDPLQLLPADAWKFKFLFNVGAHFQADLDESRVSVQLRQVFQDNCINLPEDALVARAQKDNEWLISAGTKTYIARLQVDDIYFYDYEVAIADTMDWAVRLEGMPAPANTFVHGIVYGVDWNPKGELQEPPTRPKSRTVANQVRVAVGNTAVDALAALISSQAENAGVGQIQTELLEALQYNLLTDLNEPEGKILLDQHIRQSWFGSEPGGTRWTIVARERSDSQTDQKPPILTLDQKRWLDDLNRSQRLLDAQHRLLASLQWELYALWWKSKRSYHVPLPRSKDRQEALRNVKNQLPKHLEKSNTSSLLSRVLALQNKIAALEQSVPPATGALSAERIANFARDHLDPDELVLKPEAMPRFWHPTDPVIVISGLKRSDKHGHDGTLFCRLISQTIDEIAVPYQQKEVRLTAGKLKNAIPQLASQNLPACTNQLLTEAFFLDPGNASTLALAGLQSSAAEGAVLKAIENIEIKPPEGTNIIGRFGALAWQQPWVPLFLEWQVRFYCTYKEDPDGKYQFDQEHWQFNGTDYVWTGGQVDKLRPGAISYSGRTFLTPQATVSFSDRLRDIESSLPNEKLREAAQGLRERIEKWDILSQTMSGFTSQLVMRDVEFNLLPDESIAPYVQPHWESVPFVNIVPDIDVKPETVPPFFFPLRAGFFSFQNLRIIDSFGRILDLMKANGNPGGKEQGFLPIHGRGLSPDKDGDRRLVRLVPRVVQSSRLSFRYVSAQADSQESGLADNTNPVCGWLLPNHLDNSIAVYDAGGSLLGELLLLEKSENQSIADWQPAPGNGDVQISNPHLRQMIEALKKNNDPGAAFGDLLQVIDKTLWTCDPLGERGDQNLSVLIGRPLALVRANLKLELNGRPYYNQAWHETFQAGSPVFKENHSGLLGLPFRVRLGNPKLRSNGLIGYFQGRDYGHFHAVLPEQFTPIKSTYVQQIGDGDITLKFQPTREDAFDLTGSIYLTMLIDPRGVVQAESGLLPAKTVELPQIYFEEPLKQMAVTFRIGPLLLDAQNVCIPKPAERRGDWSWIQKKGTGPGEWTTTPLNKADDAARLTSSPQVLREGWLKFFPDKIDE